MSSSRLSVCRHCGLACHRRKHFLSSRLCYYINSASTFQLERLGRSGDINPNPGPSHDRKQAKECCVCFRNIASNQRVVHCNICGSTCHVKCANVSHLNTDSVWCCTTCQCQLQLWNELPFSNTNIWEVESTENFAS